MRKFITGILLSAAVVMPLQRALAADKLVPFVTQENFSERVLNEKGFAIIEAWAIWCPFCNQAAPYVQSFYNHYSDKIKVFILDWDEQKELAKTLKINGIPRYVMFYNGQMIGQKKHIRSEENLAAWVDYMAKLSSGSTILHPEGSDTAPKESYDPSEENEAAPQSGELVVPLDK
ncbi:MAG: hypothetical protein GC134_05760 [Proteobacteria bacterium]|nr:hypothetical protein [Pseudomonadota bacterium]